MQAMNVSALTKIFPVWSREPDRSEGDSEDPLGFQRYVQSFSEEILPGLTVQTERARYYSYICWSASKILKDYQKKNKYNGEIIWRDFQDKINIFEKILALSEAAYHEQDEDNECKYIGIRKAPKVLKNQRKWVDFDFDILNRQDNSGALSRYLSSLEDLRLISVGKTIEVTENGMKLAEAFERNCKNAPKLIEKYCLDGEEFQKNKLASLGEKICLSNLSKDEKKIIIKYLFEIDHYSGKRKQTLEAVKAAAENLRQIDEFEILNSYYRAKSGIEWDLYRIQVFQYHFIAMLSIFYCLLLFRNENESFSMEDFLNAYFKVSQYERDDKIEHLLSHVKDREKNISKKIISCNGDQARVNILDNALQLALVISKRVDSDPKLIKGINNPVSYGVEELLNLVKSSQRIDLQTFMKNLLKELVDTHIDVSNSKNTAYWIRYEDSRKEILRIGYRKYDVFRIKRNPYSCRINAACSLLKDLGSI